LHFESIVVKKNLSKQAVQEPDEAFRHDLQEESQKSQVFFSEFLQYPTSGHWVRQVLFALKRNRPELQERQFVNKEPVQIIHVESQLMHCC